MKGMLMAHVTYQSQGLGPLQAWASIFAFTSCYSTVCLAAQQLILSISTQI
uniref:Uncharacterized protein n=1 Tax=Arundo donax TaxID=35708 RepID=A0A0A9B8G2_ARUDO